MARTSKRRLAVTLVVAMGVADGVGIYVAHNKLGKQAEIGPRELAVANEPLAEPIAIRTSGDLKMAPAMAASVVAPHASPAQAAPQTAHLAVTVPVKVPAPVKAPVAVAAPVAVPGSAVQSAARHTAPALVASVVAPHTSPAQAAPKPAHLAVTVPVKAPVAGKAPAAVPAAAVQSAARQTAPVVTGRVAVTQKPAARSIEARRSTAVASNGVQHEDLRVHLQHIPARLPRAERIPARDDVFAIAFADFEQEIRLPEPAYGHPDLQLHSQASVELPPLDLSTVQIQPLPAVPSEAAMPPAPPVTAAGAEEALPKS